MGTVREFYEKTAARLEDRREQLASLRRFYHSVHENERAEVIDLLASFPDVDAARELRTLYGECQWRETRLAVIRALGRFRDGRTFEFLFRLSRDVSDIPFAETAIRALGQTHHPMAARFLLNLYRDGGEVFRPLIAGALGEVPDPNAAPMLLAALREAIAADKTAMVKHLVLALGELKVAGSAEQLLPIASRRTMPSLGLCAVVSLGKILRDPTALEPLEPLYAADPFEYQVFSGAITQVRFRSQWTLEDYLQKYFESPNPHRNLPLELNGFKADDVVEGLSLFSDPKHIPRLLQVLAKLGFTETLSWYDRLVDPTKLDGPRLIEWLASLGAHHGAALGDKIERVRQQILDGAAGADGFELFDRWCEAVSLCLPDAPEVFGRLIESASYGKLTPSSRIALVNHAVHFGLMWQTSEAALARVGKFLLRLFQKETQTAVRSRLLRAFGQLGVREEKIAVFVKESARQEDLTASCLFFVEYLPHRKAPAVIDDLLEDAKLRTIHAGAILRAIGAQTTVPESEHLDAFLIEAMSSGDIDTRIETLRCLAKHPRPALYDKVVACLGADERLTLGAVVALKAFKREESSDALGGFLRGPSPSLSGRALDTLTGLPGLKPKLLVIEFLKERSGDIDVVEKIARCMEAPSTQHDHFTGVIAEILKKRPDHPHRDGLIDLAERIMSTKPGVATSVVPDGGIVDVALTKSLPNFANFDDAVKSALRAAELPFVHREMFEGTVDKSSSILEFCKALDIYLERHLGRRHLFSSLERGLHEFQNIVHGASLHEEYPSPQRVITALGLEKNFTAESLPLHKLRMVSRGILDGRILQDRFRVLDGLRAWAVVLLLFGRKSPGTSRPPMLPLKGATDMMVVGLAKRMMVLQDIRNPAAHRQTFLEYVGVSEVRDEVFRLLKDLATMVG